MNINFEPSFIFTQCAKCKENKDCIDHEMLPEPMCETCLLGFKDYVGKVLDIMKNNENK